MSYNPTNWQNSPSTNTPINAANLNNMEQGIKHASDIADDLDPRVDLVEQRLDNLIPQGTPTEGNAELIDIRVGANGITYPDAGDAVRGQYTELKSALNNISHDKVSSDNLFDNVFDKTGYYINASTGLDVENANFKCTSKFYPIENYTVVSSTIFQYFAVSSAVASMAVVYYDGNKDRVDFAQLNNLTTLDKGFADTVRFFRVSTYASFDGTVYVSAKQRSNPVDYTYATKKMINNDALPQTLQDLEEDADDGKVLSSNDFTDAEKAKLSLLNLDLQSFASVTKVYMVGEGMKYATFNAANAAWIADSKPNAVIYLAKGTYIVEDDPNHAGSYPLVFEDGNVIVIGEEKETTIIKTTTGKYIDAPILVRGGNVTLKNITFIADHSDNPSFDYSQSTTGVNGNAAYAIHIDGGSVGGTVTVENCNAWSWQSCGLGLGTIKNSEIIIKNCDVRSFTDKEIDYPDARVALSRGAIVYHTYATDDTGTEKFTMINNVVYSKNGSVVMKLTKSGTAKKDAMFVCNLLQGDEASDVVSGATDFNISDSYGNNASALNN